jgi:hypothetical protein
VYEGPEEQKAEYGYYNSNDTLKYITDSTGTVVITYGEENRVSSLRKLVDGSISTPGEHDEVTTFEYRSPEEAFCSPSTDSLETKVTYPGENEVEVYCFNAEGDFTGYTGREGEIGELADEEGDSNSTEVELLEGETFASPFATTKTTYHKYTPDNAFYEKEFPEGTFTGRATFSSSPLHFAWSWEFSADLIKRIRGAVIESATAYTLPKERKIGYSDFHIRAGTYLFHSSFPVALNQEYQLIIALNFPCESLLFTEVTCTEYVKHEFRLTHP